MENTKIEVIRSNRKTIAVEIKSDLRVIVRAPIYMSPDSIERFIEDKASWIEKHLEKMRSRAEEQRPEALGESEIRALGARALEVMPPIVSRYADMMGVSYGRITIRNQVSRWGSCSSKGNLNFNCLLMLCPEEVMNYVIIHELCHRRHMDHSKDFWADVEKYCPDWKVHRDWLKTNGTALAGRLRND